jgi:ribosomal protein S18 acetylase RimI-like enzyme
LIRRLDADDAREAVPALAEVLHDCVANGASVGFMPPFTREDAVAFYAGVLPEIEAGTRVLLAAYDGDTLVGSVQVVHAWQPNQPHRGDITKLLVHGKARGQGVGRELMEAAERAAADDGKTLLVLDTVTASPAYRLYKRQGWVEVGEIPDFALYPDGSPCATTVFYKRVTVEP